MYNPSEYCDEVVLNLASAQSQHHHRTCLYRVKCQQGPQHNCDQATGHSQTSSHPPLLQTGLVLYLSSLPECSSED